MKKILISGGQGEFAKELKKCNTKYEIIAPTKNRMDITDIYALIEAYAIIEDKTAKHYGQNTKDVPTKSKISAAGGHHCQTPAITKVVLL